MTTDYPDYEDYLWGQRITPITRIFHVLFLSRQVPKIFKKDFQWISARKGIKRNKVSSVSLIPQHFDLTIFISS